MIRRKPFPARAIKQQARSIVPSNDSAWSGLFTSVIRAQMGKPQSFGVFYRKAKRALRRTQELKFRRRPSPLSPMTVRVLSPTNAVKNVAQGLGQTTHLSLCAKYQRKEGEF